MGKRGYEKYLEREQREHERYEKEHPRESAKFVRDQRRLRKLEEKIEKRSHKPNFISRKLQERKERKQYENSLPGKREKYAHVSLDAKIEKAKTQIHQAKQKRGGSGLAKFLTGGVPPKSKGGRSGRSRSSKVSYGMGNSMFDSSHVGDGLTEMFGNGGSVYTPKNSKRGYEPKRDGLSEMFG